MADAPARVWQVLSASEAPDCTQEGIAGFRKSIGSSGWIGARGGVFEGGKSAAALLQRRRGRTSCCSLWKADIIGRGLAERCMITLKR